MLVVFRLSLLSGLTRIIGYLVKIYLFVSLSLLSEFSLRSCFLTFNFRLLVTGASTLFRFNIRQCFPLRAEYARCKSEKSSLGDQS